MLAEVTDTRDVDPEKIDRSESYFPGTFDKWGYWRTINGNGDSTPDRKAIADLIYFNLFTNKINQFKKID